MEIKDALRARLALFSLFSFGISTESQSIVDMSVDRQSTDISTNYRPTIDQLSTNVSNVITVDTT